MVQTQKLELLRKQLKLTSLAHTFDKFQVLAGLSGAYDCFNRMAGDKYKPFLLCYGGIGNGKTYLCEALSIALYKKGIRCGVTLWADLVRTLKRLMFRPRANDIPYDEYFENVRQASHLILDDVGMGTGGTDWEFGELEDIINYRYKERLFTVVTTNRDIDDLPERVVSRFSDPQVGIIVINKGRDYRRR